MIQCQFLNKVLQENDASLIVMNNLDESFFSDYKNEYKFIMNHLSEYGKVPDIETFIAAFNDFDVINVKEPATYLLDELYNDKNRRELAKVFNNVRKLLNEDKLEEATSEYLKASESIVKSQSIQCVDIFKNTSRYDDYVDKCSNSDKYYISTGFKELDNLIGGWDRTEELATIVARTGYGKSWCLLKTAVEAAKQGLTVGIYSGEMSENKVGYRIDTLISHISNGSIVHGNIDAQVQYEKYIRELPNKFNGTIKVLTPAMINGTAGVTALRAFIEKEHLDMLCIDQHSLLDDDRKARNPVERASNISKDLKTLQVLKKIPIISVSQQNRGDTDNGVTTSHIAQSDRIAQDSTTIIFIERKESRLTLNLVKSRDSVNGKKLTYDCDINKGIFEYIPDEKEAQEYVDQLGREAKEEEFEEDPFS